MNQISLIGIVAAVPVAHIEGDIKYTTFELRVHGAYLDHNGDSYSYIETFRVICVGRPTEFIRIIPRYQEIEVTGELRTRVHVLRAGGPITVEIACPIPEVIVSSIKWRDVIVTRTGGDDIVIALYKPDPS